MLKRIFILFFAGAMLSISAEAQHNRININNNDIFVSGMNMAWGSFANDLTSFNETTFIRALDEISAAGGNSMRWWLHVNGTKSPQFTDGKVSGITEAEIANVKRVLDLAHERNMVVSLCLWSFDMLQGDQGIDFTQNRNLLEDTAYTHAYIRNALIPMVTALKGHKAILCWEIFNEPEGMTTEFGWTPQRTTMKFVQQFINLTAGAIHREAPDEKVSNGSWSFRASSDLGDYKNFYSDAELVAAGGDTLGKLDFYMVHYYDWGGTALSPFHHPVSYWGLDKPVVIAEFSAHGPIAGVTPLEAYTYLYNNGYAGAMGWAWTAHDGNGGVKDAAPGMQFLIMNYPNDIKLSITPDYNYAPFVNESIPDFSAEVGITDSLNFVDLTSIFYDMENNADLVFEVATNNNPEFVNVIINDTKHIDLHFTPNVANDAIVTIKATDLAGKSNKETFKVELVEGVGIGENLNQSNFFDLKIEPNPVRYDALVCFNLKSQSSVFLTIYDLNGKIIKTTAVESKQAGEHRIKLNMVNLHNGIYLAELNALGKIQTQKIVVSN